MTDSPPRPAAQAPYAGACEALSALTNASGSGPTFDPATPLRTGEWGSVPLGALDWLVLAASDHSVPLEVVEAGPDEWPEWLRGDVPLLAALEARGDLPAQWMLLERAGDDYARVRLFGADEAEEHEVHLAELPVWVAGVGLERDKRLRLVAVSSEPERSIAGGTSNGERLGPVRRLSMLVRPDSKDLLAVALFAVVVGVLMLSTPIAVQSLVNTVALGANVPNLVLVVLLLGIGLAAAGVLRALQTWIVELLQRRLFVRVVADLAARLPRVALGEGAHRVGPELVNRYFDLMNIQKQGSFLLLEGLSLLLSVLVGLLVLAVYHPLLLAFDILLVGVIALIALGPMRRGVKTAIKESSVKYEVAAWLEELARNPLLFKSSGAMKLVYERTDSLAREWVERRTQHFGVVFFQGISAIALQVIASVLLLGIGGLLVIQGSLTLGQLVAAELIVTTVVGSVANIGKYLESFYDLVAATDKLGYLLDIPLEREGGEHHLPAADGPGSHLELRGLGWTPEGGRRVFAGVDLEVLPGERIGIAGPSGSGKSSLLRMIWGLRRPTEGCVRLDGRDLRSLSLESLRRTVGLVDPAELYDDTVAENVRLGRPFVSDEDVRGALRAVGLLDELSYLPEGIQTRLGVDGLPLSMNERARVQVARAIAGRPRLLLVTDLFGGLPKDLRDSLMDLLFDADAPWTLVITSNDVDVLGRCERTFSLTGGRLEKLQPTSTASA
jgi:putative ABC transport system ATP-binding protein